MEAKDLPGIEELLSKGPKVIKFESEDQAKAFMSALRSVVERSEEDLAEENCDNLKLWNEIIQLLKKRFDAQGSHSFRLKMEGFETPEVDVNFYCDDDGSYKSYRIIIDDYTVSETNFGEHSHSFEIGYKYKAEEFGNISRTGMELHGFLHTLLESLEEKWVEIDGELFEKVAKKSE